MPKISVVVVDDSALVRSMLTEIINRQADMECIGAASDPFVAREMIRNLNPDVITLDVEMPRMDGLDFLSKLMRLRPMPVVMVSTLTERGAEVTLKALELGAVDFVSKPKIGVVDGLRQLSDDITDKIRVASKARIHRLAPAASVTPASASATGATSPRAASASAPAPAKALNTGSYSLGRLSTEKLIFIGASTGGTEATKEVLVALPADSPGVVITQHMPPGFTRNYAARLDGLCKIRVKEASDGERILPGHAYIAPGGLHLSVERSGANYIARVQDGDPVNRHKPSVEVLFDSAAKVVGPNGNKGGIEAALDVDYMTTLGSGVPTEFWSYAGSQPDNEQNEPFLDWLVDLGNAPNPPLVFSTSYGEDEASVSLDYATRMNQEFQKNSLRGITFLFASGDSGVGSAFGPCTTYTPQYPSDSPYVTAVGATTGTNPETAASLSSGGFSNRWARPSWQDDAVAAYLSSAPNLPDASLYNATGRGFPDVSAQGTGFVVVNNGKTVPAVAGTSASSPTFGGIVGLLVSIHTILFIFYAVV